MSDYHLTKEWIENIWQSFKTDELQNPEGVVDQIDKELKNHPMLVNWVIEEYTREEDPFYKDHLACLIVYHTPYTPAIEWLRDNSDWTKEDFAEFGINIDDY